MDKSRKDVNGLCFISHDPDLVFSDSAVEIHVETKNKNVDEKCINEIDLKIKWGSTDWYQVFESAGLIRGAQENRVNVLCPWRDQHTKDKDNGSYLFLGSEGTWGWTCHHDHCQGRNLKHLAFELKDHVIKFSQGFIPDSTKRIKVEDTEENPESISWPPANPLPKNEDPPPQLDPEILPNPLSEFCRAAALENETAPEAVAGFLLAALGIITGTRLAIKPDPEKPSWFEYGVRSVALVMPVSSNKTAVFRSGLAPLEKIQKSKNKLYRLRSRVIGERGKARRHIEKMCNVKISVYGKTVMIIGKISDIEVAKDAVECLLRGAKHGNAYQRADRLKKRKRFFEMKDKS